MIVDSAAKSYYERSRLWSDFYAVTGAELKLIEQYHANLVGLDVLEVGCGNGRLSTRLAPLCKSMTGIDQDERLIACVSKQCEDSGLTNAGFQTGEAESLPFTDKRFDLVLMPWMLHQVKNKEKALSEALRVLKQNGKLLVFGLLPDCDYDRIARHFVPAFDRQINPQTDYEEPIKKVFGKVQVETLPEDGHSYCFLFPSCAVTHEAFSFAFENWYNCTLSPWDRGKLRRLIQTFRQGNLIKLQTRGLLLAASKEG